MNSSALHYIKSVLWYLSRGCQLMLSILEYSSFIDKYEVSTKSIKKIVEILKKALNLSKFLKLDEYL